jgi:hypothetical protein
VHPKTPSDTNTLDLTIGVRTVVSAWAQRRKYIGGCRTPAMWPFFPTHLISPAPPPADPPAPLPRFDAIMFGHRYIETQRSHHSLGSCCMAALSGTQCFSGHDIFCRCWLLRQPLPPRLYVHRFATLRHDAALLLPCAQQCLAPTSRLPHPPTYSTMCLRT